MKQSHLIVLDLDGTLMSSFSEYDEETFTYLRKLKAEGHIIMLATGRPKRSSYFVYQALNLNTPLINYNGARISNPTDPLFEETDLRIDRFDLLDIINHVRPYLINVFCEIHDDIYVEQYNEEIHPFLHVEGGILTIGKLNDTLPDNPNGALLFIKKEFVAGFQEYITTSYHGTLLSRYWGVDDYHIVEIFNPNVDKKTGMIKAMQYYQIPQERTIAIGDGHNDIGLLQTAGIKVAMGNAHPELIKYAHYQTDDCFNQGVLKFLKAFFEGDKMV